MGRPAVDIDALTAEERLDLIERLWDSLDPSRDIPVGDEQRGELVARSDALDRGDLPTMDAHEVLEAIRARRA